MKRKALLLIIPFAAAGLAGCQQTNPNRPASQCDLSQVVLSQEEATLKVGEKLTLTATAPEDCTNLSWTVTQEGQVVTLNSNGDECEVSAVSEGTAVISYGGKTCNITVQGDTPTPPPGPVEPEHAGTETDPYTPADAAIVAGKLEETTDSTNPIATDKQYYIKGTVSKLAEQFDAQYGNYSFWLGDDEFQVWRIKNGENKDKFNEGDIAPGYEVTIKAKIMNFKGTPENTTDSYVVSVNKGDPDAPSITLDKTSARIAKDETVTITASVQNSDEAVSWSVTSGSDKISYVENGKSVTVTGVAAGSATIRATLGSTGKYKDCNITVLSGEGPQHAGTETDPYTPADAAIVAGGLEQTTDSKNPIATDKQYYIKGTVSKLAKAFEAQYGSYSFWLGNDEFEVWQIYNGSNKAKFNEGDIAPGDEVTIKAKIMNFKGTPENTTDSYVVSVNKGGDPASPTINLSAYSATINVDASTTVTATVANSDEEVSWSVTSGADKVSITPSGKSVTILGVAAGNAVVRATLGTTGLYKECNVTVKGEPPVIEGIVLDFADLTGVSGTKDGVTYTSAKENGQSDPAYNDANKELRLYAKNTLTISGSNITKITFDYNGCYGPDPDPCKKALADFASASVGSYSAGTWTGSATDSVTFTVEDTNQMHIHQIGVVCSQPTPPVDRILDSISVSDAHRAFEVGDDFIKETVTAHFTNANDADVTNLATFTGYDMDTAGTQTVNVSYTENNVEKTTSYSITVSVPAEKTEYNFTADSQTSYTDDDKSGATIEITGATGYEGERGVAWNKSEGSVKISGLKAGTIKKITLDVSHNKTTNPTVSVSVGGNAYGSAFTIEKVNHVSAEFTGDVTAGDVIVSISKTTDGSIWLKKVTITYEAGEPPVVEPAVNKVTVSPSTAKLDLVETTSTTLVATVDAVGDADESVTWSVSPEGIVEVENGVVTAKAEGSATVTATSVFDGTKSASCEVEVLGQPAPEPVLTEIYIDGDMTNKTYNLGDSWSSAGLQVKAKWTEGKEDTLLDASEYDLAFNPTAPAAGTTQVVVTATLKADGTKTANKTVTDITVNEKANSVKTAYDAAMALEDGGVTTSEYTFEGVVTATQGSSFVVYDRDYAILVYNKSVSGLAVGKTVKVVSTMQNYGGLAETKTISSATLTGTGTVPEAVNITSVAQLSELKTNILVDCAQIEVVSKQSGWSSSSNNNWNVKINGETVTLSLSKYTYDAIKASTLSELNVGDKFTARNLIIGSFKGTRQLSSTGESTFSKFVPEVTAVSVTGDFTKKSYNLGNDWDISGLVFKGTTADGEITLNSSDFEFEFNPAKASDAKINSVEVTATYKAKPTLSCTTTITGITVNDAPAVEPYDVTFQKNTSASSYTSTYNQTLDDIEWVLNGNGSIDNYVKLSSGTANTTADRYICSQTAFDNEASQIIFKTGAIDSAATVNSVTLTVYSSAEDAKSGSNSIESVSGTWVTSGEMSFSKPTGSNWSGKYFRLTLNLSNTTKNKGVIITGVKVVF